MIVKNEKEEILGYSLFRKAYDSQGSVKAIILHQCKARDNSRESIDVIQHKIKEVRNMPHLVIRGISVQDLKQISIPLVEELADICECGTDNFTLELLQATHIFNGEEVPVFSLIEVKWFERGQESRDRIASSIIKHIQSTGVKEVEVAFIPFEASAYYINGKRCSD